MNISLSELRTAAVEFAKMGGDSTLSYFKKSFDVEFKSDDSPVTNADRNAEQIIRKKIKEHFPEHGIIGEEYGNENEDSEIVWVLDPIDGTKSFIHGVPFYTTLIGIMIHQRPEVGVIYAPALGEITSAATGLGCTLNGKKISVRECNDVSSATFLSTEVNTFFEYNYGDAFHKLLSNSRLHRTWGDAYGHMMVAAGRADFMIDPVLSIWDAAALQPVLTESGGSFTDLHGKETIHSGNALSCSKNIASEILKHFE